MTDDKSPDQRRWIDEAEDALNRASDALKAAWEQTRDARTATLETAKEAANRLGEAIDQGIEAAKRSWEPTPDAEPEIREEE